MQLNKIRLENKLDKFFDPYINFEYFKGGGTPQPTDPMREAEARMAEERERARIAAETETRDRTRRNEERQGRISSNTGRLQNSRQAAEAYGQGELSRRGLASDAYGIFDTYRSSLDRAGNNFDLATETYSDPYGTSLFTDAFNNAQSEERRKLRRGADEFAGDGFAETMFADTADDAILDSIIGDQYTDAMGNIDRNYARGGLNDSSYAYAKSELEKAKRSGRARAEDMGLGVLQGYRNSLNDESKRLYGKIDNFELGDGFDLAKQRAGLEGLAGRNRNRMEGDILNAIGGTTFFDTDSILGKAKTRNGVTNNNNTGLNLGNSFSNTSNAESALLNRSLNEQGVL